MELYDKSRFIRARFQQVTDADGDSYVVPQLTQTTMPEYWLPEETIWYTVKGNEKYEDIAYDFYYDLGGPDLWWVLAMCNPEIFFPMDLQAGDKIRIPPTRFVEDMLASRDDWEEIWREVAR